MDRKILKIHIIHVGDMANKGAQALLKSEVSMLREIFPRSKISVSTFDIEGVKALNLQLEHVTPTLIDIPYKEANSRAKMMSYDRDSIRFKVDLLLRLFFVPIQTLIAFASCILAQMGIASFYRSEAINAFKNCDLVISTSDENFKEGNLNFPFNVAWIVTWWSLLFERTFEVVIAKKVFKKRVIMFPNSVGPFRSFIGRMLAKIAFKNVDILLIRDRISVSIVKSLGEKLKIMLTADAAVNFKPKAQKNLEELQHPAIGVAAGVYFNALKDDELENYISAHAKALDSMISKYGANVVFLPHDVTGFEKDDYSISMSILQRMKYKEQAKIICTKSVDEYKLLLGQLEILISSKMHPAVLAASSMVPALYIVYDHKQYGFFEHLGLLDYCLNVNEISYSLLIKKMENLWTNRKELARLLNKRIPVLQENVKKAIRMALLVS